MSEHLPDDLRKWPTDPYQLLGVGPDVSTRELKRAYTALIRRFKPEQFPEQFRRTRDAYENILRFLQFQQKFSWPMPPGPGPESIPETGGRAAQSSENDTPAPLPPERLAEERLPESVDRHEMQVLWDRACDGDCAGAYGRLVELHQESPLPREEVLLRLYWLRVAAPELDPERPQCEWLAAGLRGNGLRGPYWELYRREIDKDPSEALSDRFGSLLRVPASPHTLADFLEWRWQAAGRLKSWPVITADLDAFRPRLAADDEEIWCRLLLFAVDQLAWRRDHSIGNALEQCLREISELGHVHERLGDALFRLDILLELVDAWKDLLGDPEVPRPLLELVPRTWTRSFAEVQRAMRNYLDSLAGHPRDALETFDTLKRKAPAVLAQLGRTIEFLHLNPAIYADPQLLPQWTALAQGFLEQLDLCDYGTFRAHVLDFCLAEAIPLGIVADALADSQDLAAWHEYVPYLREDWPLHYVFAGHQAFWAGGG
jgi:hypothetical protein